MLKTNEQTAMDRKPVWTGSRKEYQNPESRTWNNYVMIFKEK